MTDLLSLLAKIENNHHQSKNDRVLIIDSTNTFLRVWSSVPIISDTGEHVGGILGFLRSIGSNIRSYNASRCILVFDGKGGSSRRRKIFPEYKMQRSGKYNIRRDEYLSVEDEVESQRRQMARTIEYLHNLPVQVFCMDHVEADDVIAYISTQVLSDAKIRIVSTDRDFLQLVDDRIEVYSPVKKKLYGFDQISEDYGVFPSNYLLYRTLTGDVADNIPGIRGAGLKTLIKRFPDIAKRHLTYDELCDRIRSNQTPTKIERDLLSESKIVDRNRRLMQLHDVDVSSINKIKINEVVNGQIPRLDRVNFLKMIVEDQLPMKHPESWLRDTFHNLNLWIE